MTVELTIAVVGDLAALSADAEGAIGGLSDEDLRTPYVDRRIVALEVEPSETLGAVLREAARTAGAQLPPWASWDSWVPAFISFYSAKRDPDLGWLRHEVTLLDPHERVRWTFAWADEPVGEFLRASDAGVLDGDARKPYLLLQPPMGNGIITDFPTFVELWRLWWDIADKVGILGGLWAIWKGVSPRLRRDSVPTPVDTPDLIEGLYRGWIDNGARPDNLVAFLGQRPWHLQDLAQMLDCTPAQAQALLLGFGHERNDSGLWVPGDSAPAQLLQGSAEFVIHAGMTTTRDAIERVLRERAERYASTGTTAPLDWTQMGDLPFDDRRLGPRSGQRSDVELRERLELVLRYRAASVLHRVRAAFRRR